MFSGLGGSSTIPSFHGHTSIPQQSDITAMDMAGLPPPCTKMRLRFTRITSCKFHGVLLRIISAEEKHPLPPFQQNFEIY